MVFDDTRYDIEIEQREDLEIFLYVLIRSIHEILVGEIRAGFGRIKKNGVSFRFSELFSGGIRD